jgi:hypothetical protein
VTIRCGDAEHTLRITRDAKLVILDHDLEMVAAFTAFGAEQPHCLRVAEAMQKPMEHLAGWWNPRFNVAEITSIAGFKEALAPGFSTKVEAQEAALDAVLRALSALGSYDSQALYYAAERAMTARYLVSWWRRLELSLLDVDYIRFSPGWEPLLEDFYAHFPRSR